ncbi:YigZ family protein [Mangrovibacillus cuniculi]|uniref:YigZ family protein n=1 Tax=Mangrovibacillus cuniculi TaxID=2593652 RepID=A0A7S8HGK3_9BACI|nr:YigZ family protein [Mangrovibacillus cuniculi]QPC47525.1 YigZ family protein [Mangrovibacillus cuniculi]
MLNTYKTVKISDEVSELIIERSQFLTHTKRVTSEEEAQAFIQEIKKKHKTANHNCSAYMIGEHNQIQKANDDGEPTGTAGVPMLEVLKKRDVKDTAVVVTRYFGGVKLGAGGLIRAYSKATSEGLNEIGVVERTLMQVMTTVVDYTWLGKLENELRQSPYDVKSIDYLDLVHVHTFVPTTEMESFTEWMTELTNGQGEIRTGETVYHEKLLPKV